MTAWLFRNIAILIGWLVIIAGAGAIGWLLDIAELYLAPMMWLCIGGLVLAHRNASVVGGGSRLGRADFGRRRRLRRRAGGEGREGRCDETGGGTEREQVGTGHESSRDGVMIRCQS